ncbi:hypothetical protein JTB14_027761 [Gonioctena quinquepunctata]|nr:hypothetical protein JTB14_027761 [Gonioctena quinquepunctata]
MVDMADKAVTKRSAKAIATVKVGPQITELIHKNSMKKGDVLTIAEIAGIIGAKRTSEIIPLCHNIALSSVLVSVQLNVKMEAVQIEATVNCEALTVYDMCKAVSKGIVITDICLVSKTGGKSGAYVQEEIFLRDYNRGPTTSRFPPLVGAL